MVKQLIFSLLVCIISCFAKANDSSIVFKHFKTIYGDFKNFSVDNLGNIYLINSSNQIKKLNNNFDSVAVFNDTRQYGNITQIDVSNPLKILIFYGEFSTILVLDRFLNVRNKIDLRKQNIFKASTITLSYDNYIWLFDELENKIKKVGDDGIVLIESNDFRMVFDSLFVPETIIDNDGMLYLYNPLKGLIISDYYGAIKKLNPILHLKYFQINGNNFVGFKKHEMFNYSTNLLQSYIKKVIGLDTSSSKVLIKEKFCFQLLQNEIEVKILE